MYIYIYIYMCRRRSCYRPPGSRRSWWASRSGPRFGDHTVQIYNIKLQKANLASAQMINVIGWGTTPGTPVVTSLN